MSVVINNIDIPESCYVCPLRETNWPGGMACRITNQVCPINASNDPSTRPQWCPLSEHKEPKRRSGGRKKKSDN